MGVGSVMAHTPTIRKVAVLVLFSLVQFFWFTATFTYSESRTVRSDVERSLRVTVPAVPEVADVPAVRDLPKSTVTIPSSVSDSAFDIARSTLELANPGKSKSAKSGFEGDLGAQIKYCIVFPLLNSVGPPIPTFDVPVCPTGTSTPPAGSSRLTVVKVVINDDSGTATTSDFTLRVGSTTIVSGATLVVSPGTYVVSEATTTVTVGTTTMTYVQSFSGDCNTSGNVTLASGGAKTCTITNDDPGAGGQGGEGNGGDGDGGGSDGDGGGGNGDGNGGGGGGGGRSGRVLGQATPEFMGGADGVPGVPNTGGGGEAGGTLGLLVFSFTPTFFGLAYLSMSFWKPRSRH